MTEFPGNSRNLRKEQPALKAEKKIDRITVNDPVQRKKPLGRRFVELFVGGDTRGVLGSVLMEVIVPATKELIVDVGREGVERMVFGENRTAARRANQGRTGGPSGYYSYGAASRSGPIGAREEPRQISSRARARHDFDEIILPTRAEAEDVIDGLFQIVSQYDIVTVADLYAMVGIASNPIDTQWGWSDIRPPGGGSSVQRVRNGYLLNLPKPEHLD